MKQRRLASAAALALPLALLASACGSGGSGGSDDPTHLTFWDGFTQYNTGGSPFEELIATCQEKTGITIDRTVSENINDKYTRAASTGDLPDLLVLDNPNVAQFAETGILADNEASGIDTSRMQPNIVASGIYEGKTYGAPFGSNTLALFYDVDAFAEAGLQPPTDWDSLRTAAAALTDRATGRYGIAFSARPDQEGTFQFLPFFWGAGAELTDIDSPAAVEALTLWSDLVADGDASGENVTFNQQEIRDQFLARHAAMMVNGTWQLNPLDDSDVNYAVVPIPAQDGGPAASPLGGEFINVVQNENPEIVKAAGEFATCFTAPENLAAWLAGQTYISPYADQAEQQAADDPRLAPWVEAVGAARSRTEDLGSSFAAVSNKLGEALSGAVAGQSDPATALAAAAQ